MPVQELSGVETNWHATGKGEALIFIHGVGMDHTMWEKQVDYFASDYRVISYDMMGHGKSGKLDREYELKDFVEQLRDLIDHLKVKQAHIVGFSMGALVTQLFGIHYPEKTKTLTFMNAVANRTEEQQRAVWNRVKQVEQEGHHSTIHDALARWFSESYREEYPKVIENVKTRLENNDPSSYLKAYKVFATADQELWPEMSNITSPTFIITGEEDIGSTPKMAEDMHHKIPGSELLIVPGYKHMLPMEGHKYVNTALSEFLKRAR